MSNNIEKEVAALFSEANYWPRGGFFRSDSHQQFMLSLQQHAPAAGKCLDLGCGGDARYKPFIQAHGLEWYGADVIELNHPETNYRQVTNNRLQFEAAFFDVICAFNVIEHFTHPEEMFVEIQRCLKPGAVFCGACAFWETEHDSFFHLTSKGLSALLSRHGFELISLAPSEYSGSVLDAQRLFGGGGRIVKAPRGAWARSLLRCNLNWIPFIVANLLELSRRLVLGRSYNPFKNCATLYFYARKG
jgi:SAM-dependent methyltransferase